MAAAKSNQILIEGILVGKKLRRKESIGNDLRDHPCNALLIEYEKESKVLNMLNKEYLSENSILRERIGKLEKENSMLRVQIKTDSSVESLVESSRKNLRMCSYISSNNKKPKKKKEKRNHKKLYKEWIKYYESSKDRAVDFNEKEIGTNKGALYLERILNGKEKLREVFNSFGTEKGNRIDSIEIFNAVLLNPTWYDKYQYRKDLVEIIKKLDLDKDEFVNSKLVTNYFNK